MEDSNPHLVLIVSATRMYDAYQSSRDKILQLAQTPSADIFYSGEHIDASYLPDGKSTKVLRSIDELSSSEFTWTEVTLAGGFLEMCLLNTYKALVPQFETSQPHINLPTRGIYHRDNNLRVRSVEETLSSGADARKLFDAYHKFARLAGYKVVMTEPGIIAPQHEKRTLTLNIDRS